MFNYSVSNESIVTTETRYTRKELLTDIDQSNAFIVFQEPQYHGDILQLLRPKRGSFIVLANLLAGQNLDQGHQPQTIGQVVFQVGQVLVHSLQVLVSPAGEGVLLNELPFSVVG